MPFKPGNKGGPGRPKKIVEEAQQSILEQLFNAEAERMVIVNMIALASLEGKQAVPAATWLWDRKYGKVKEKVEHDGGLTIRVEYADVDSDTSQTTPRPA